MNKYFHLKKTLMKCSVYATEELLQSLQEQPRIQELLKQKKVKILESSAVRTPFTIGIWHPLIYLPEKGFARDEFGMVCCHELTHIKKRDVLVKFICLLIVLLHWFNPFSYLLLIEFSRVSEYRCDEDVLSLIGGENRRSYAELVVRSAASAGRSSRVWISSFAGRKKDIYYRVEAIMDRKKKSSITVLAVMLSVLCSSMTVYAYKMENRVSRNEDRNIGWTIEMYGEWVPDSYAVPTDDGGFVMVEEPVPDFSRSDSIFIVDGTGMVFSLTEGAATSYGLCAHTYVTGKIQEHDYDSKGGCTVWTYESKRCAKCGYLIKGKLIEKRILVTCPHQCKR